MKTLLTFNETREKLNISKETLYRMVKRRDIPYLKIGKLLRFKVESVDAWINSHYIKSKKDYSKWEKKNENNNA